MADFLKNRLRLGKAGILSLACAVFVLAANAASENIIANGGFDDGVEGWSGKIVTKRDEGRQIVPAPKFVSHKTDDGVGDGKGCLKVEFSGLDERCATHMSGAHARLREPIPPNTKVKITFHAKSVSGSRRLTITKPNGGGAAGPVMMSGEWRKFELPYSSDWPTQGLLFGIVDHYGGRKSQLEEGEFLLDKVAVEKVASPVPDQQSESAKIAERTEKKTPAVLVMGGEIQKSPGLQLPQMAA